MIGHKNLDGCHSIIFIVGSNPLWFDGQHGSGVGLIYSQKSRPKPNDVYFLKGKNIQVIHGKDAADELYAKWLVEIIKANPMSVVAMDSEMEIFIC